MLRVNVALESGSSRFNYGGLNDVAGLDHTAEGGVKVADGGDGAVAADGSSEGSRFVERIRDGCGVG